MTGIDHEQVDQALKDGFMKLPRPTLSPGFNRHIRETLAREKLRGQAVRNRVRFLQAYWAISTIAVVVILLALAWTGPSGISWIPLLVVAVVVALPMSLVRVELVGLVLGTVERIREHT